MSYDKADFLFLDIWPSEVAGATGPGEPRWVEYHLNGRSWANIPAQELPIEMVREARSSGYTVDDCLEYMRTSAWEGTPVQAKFSMNDVGRQTNYFRVLFCDFEELPLYIDSESLGAKIILQMRLDLGV